MRYASAQTILLPVRRDVKDLRAINVELTASDATAMAAVLESIRFLPGDLPYYRIAPTIEREYVLPILRGDRRPPQAAATTQGKVNQLLSEF